MTPDDSLLSMYRTPLEPGFSWNLLDHSDRWTIDVSVPAGIHRDGLLGVEAAVDELRMALEFAVDSTYGDPVIA